MRHFLVFSVGLGFAVGCGGLGVDSSSSTGTGGYGFGGAAQGGEGAAVGGAGGAGGASAGGSGPFDYRALCGLYEGSCIPGTECGLEGPGGGGVGAGGGQASGGASAAGGYDVGGASNEGGANGLNGGGGAGDGEPSGGPDGGPDGGVEPSFGCQVVPTEAGPVPKCVEVGSLPVGARCLASAECAVGLACVLSEAVSPQSPEAKGVCEPYCCGALDESCPGEGTFCRPKVVLSGEFKLEVPVCTDLESCTLLGDDCPGGETCAIVRADGATSCVPIGTGALCQPCPCADGYTCNFGTGTCVALCDTAQNDCPGRNAICQGGAGEVGICIGGDSTCPTL